MDDVTVGIDIGTTSVKAIAVDGDGRVLSQARIPHRLVIDAPDHLAHDAAQAWRRGPRRALRALGPHGERAAAVAVASMVPSITAVNRRGVPITEGLLYGDVRGRRDGSGGAGRPGELLNFVEWATTTAPDAAGYWPATAVASFALAGRAVIDDIVPAATGGALWDGDAWNAAAAERVGARVDQLPETAAPGTAVGPLTDAPGTLLVTGCPDALAESLVAGADSAGDVHVMLGTTLIIRAVARADTYTGEYGSTAGPDPDHIRVGGASTAGGLFVNWALRSLRDTTAPADPHRVPVWAPYPRGERSPVDDPDRRASIADLDLTHDTAAIRRAVFEASGFVVRRIVEAAGPSGGAPRRIIATGGGSQSDEWVQALADCTGLPVDRAAVPDSAALGTAFVARVGVGLASELSQARAWARTRARVEPDARWVDACAERYERFVTLSTAS